MGRIDELSRTENPVSKYIGWKSNDKKFGSYNKISKKTELIDLPVSFIYVTSTVSIKGWSEANSCGIWSNQVTNTSNEILVVKADKKIIASGLYKDIKDKVKAEGGRFIQNVFCTIDGEPCVIEIKGASLMAWSNFFKAAQQKLKYNLCKVDGFVDGKKGAVKYTVPKFEVGEKISTIALEESDIMYESVKSYLKQYKLSEDTKEEQANDIEVETDQDEDLPF